MIKSKDEQRMVIKTLTSKEERKFRHVSFIGLLYGLTI